MEEEATKWMCNSFYLSFSTVHQKQFSTVQSEPKKTMPKPASGAVPVSFKCSRMIFTLLFLTPLPSSKVPVDLNKSRSLAHKQNNSLWQHCSLTTWDQKRIALYHCEEAARTKYKNHTVFFTGRKPPRWTSPLGRYLQWQVS